VEGGVFRAGGGSLAAPGVADGPATAFLRPDQLVPTHDAAHKVELKRIIPRDPLLWLDCVDETGRVLEAAVVRAGAPELLPGASINLALTGGHLFQRLD